MNHKKIIPFINAENEYPANVIQLANRYSCEGADELFYIIIPEMKLPERSFCLPCGRLKNRSTFHLRLESMYHGLRMPKGTLYRSKFCCDP